MGDDVDLRRPFRRADGLAAGLTPAQLRGPRFVALARGVYAAREVAHLPLVRAQAAVMLFPAGAVASHATAARVHGAVLPALPDDHVTVLEPADRRYYRGIRPHCVRATQAVRVDGVLVSSLEQAFVELGELISLVDLVIAGDHWVRKKQTTPGRLVAYCRSSSHRGARRALAAARLVRERVDSPQETRLRLLLVLAGMPEPTVGLVIRDEHGEPIAQHDLAYEKQRMAVHYDGRVHVEIVEQWEKDLLKRGAAEDDGWRLLTVIAAGIFKHPEQTLQRVHRAARRLGVPGVPERLSTEWRKHFPGYR